MFKKLIEKLYYKCYPDRVKEHKFYMDEMEYSRIHQFDKRQYKLGTIQCVRIVTQEEMKCFGDDALKYAKRHLLEKMIDEIEPFITFKSEDRPELCANEIWAQLTVVDRR